MIATELIVNKSIQKLLYIYIFQYLDCTVLNCRMTDE